MFSIKCDLGIKYGKDAHYHSAGLPSASLCGYRAVNINVWDHKLLIVLCMTLCWGNKCHKDTDQKLISRFGLSCQTCMC